MPNTTTGPQPQPAAVSTPCNSIEKSINYTFFLGPTNASCQPLHLDRGCKPR